MQSLRYVAPLVQSAQNTQEQLYKQAGLINIISTAGGTCISGWISSS